MQNTGTTRAFSILEIAVVLMVVALMVGGVLAGRSLIESSNLRRVVDDVEMYRRAVAQFQEKYNELPGDMTSATQVWGIAGGTGSNSVCLLTDSTGRKSTCNGNGDGLIWTGLVCPMGNEDWCFGELHRAWQHLANAGLIEGSFSGMHAMTNWWHTIGGVNAPKAPFEGSIYGFSHLEVKAAGDPDYFARAHAANVLFFGTQVNAAAGVPSNPLMHASIMFKLDSKVDDGLPGTGLVTTLNSTTALQPGCVSTNVVNTSRYVVSAAQKLCAWVYFEIKK